MFLETTYVSDERKIVNKIMVGGTERLQIN